MSALSRSMPSASRPISRTAWGAVFVKNTFPNGVW
jgi:hypothetical protein